MYLGIEIGGTKLQLGVGDGHSPKFAGFRRLDVDPSAGAEGILAQIESAGRELISAHPVDAVGYGFGGPINAAAGVITKSHQITGWDGFAIVDWTRQTLGKPTFLGNDCDMAALAEARFGAGRESRGVLYVTVGTGVGGGLVFDGELYGAHRPAAAEIGHLRPGLEAGDLHNTVETIASGRGIEAAIREAMMKGGTGNRDVAQLFERCNQDPSKFTAKMTAEAAQAGNPIAIRIMSRAVQALGWGIAQVITLLAVDTVVVGGGVSLAGEKLFYNPLRGEVTRYVFPPLRATYEIVPPKLGEEVVVHGAVAMAAMRHSKILGERGA